MTEQRTVTLYTDYKSPYAYLAKDPAYALERDFSGRGADFGCDPRPCFVGFGEGVEWDVLLDRQGEMTPGDSERALDFVEAAQI